MGCGVRPSQGLGIKAVVYEFLVFKIGELLFLQGDVSTYSTISPKYKKTILLTIKAFLNIYIYFLSFSLENLNRKIER